MPAERDVDSLRRHQAFSLVELSIVLVILGLLVGGILSGQSLIRAAEMRSVSTEYQRYYTAMQSFRDKYFAIPGDMANATSFWTAVAVPASCAATASTTAATCNGDGNGQVDIPTGSNEQFRFWQHLGNAGLIEGTYSGVAGAGGANNVVAGTNAPRPKMNNGGWGFSWLGNYASGDNWTYGLDYGNVFWFGTAYTGRAEVGILKPEEAWNIDTKVDDGKPGTGKVIARDVVSAFGNAAACTTSANQTDYAGVYRLTSTALICALIIRQQ